MLKCPPFSVAAKSEPQIRCWDAVDSGFPLRMNGSFPETEFCTKGVRREGVGTCAWGTGSRLALGSGDGSQFALFPWMTWKSPKCVGWLVPQGVQGVLMGRNRKVCCVKYPQLPKIVWLSCSVNIHNLAPFLKIDGRSCCQFYPRSQISLDLCTYCNSTRAVSDTLRGALSGLRTDAQLNASQRCGRESDQERVP